MKFTIAKTHNWLLKKIPNSSDFKVVEEFYWYIDYNIKEIKIIVPEGFKTNFGSIPRFLWIFFDKTKYISYILHDYLYSKNWDNVTRKWADLILLEALNVEWASFMERVSIYFWVRIGGFLFYKKK